MNFSICLNDCIFSALLIYTHKSIITRGCRVSLKGKIAEFALLNIIKWCVIIVFAGIVLYFITPKYEMIKDGQCFNKITGRLQPVKTP
jgi:hypothetical protein